MLDSIHVSAVVCAGYGVGVGVVGCGSCGSGAYHDDEEDVLCESGGTRRTSAAIRVQVPWVGS